MRETYYIRLVTAPAPDRLSQLMNLESVEILCTHRGKELMSGLHTKQHGPIYEDNFYAYKKALCRAGIFYVFHGPDLLQFAENYFFIDASKYQEATDLLPETVRLMDYCTIL